MRPSGALPKIAKKARHPKGPDRAADLLRDAQHLIVEAAGLLGSGPEDGGLWDAVAILVDQREAADQRAVDEPSSTDIR
ncbi:MAG TPA: hypothetical protein VIJ54_08355 [Actinomycetes bacterium]